VSSNLVIEIRMQRLRSQISSCCEKVEQEVLYEPGLLSSGTTPQPDPSQASPACGLLRVLGLGFGVSVTLGNTIGAGIMGTPGEIATRIPVPALIIAAWVAGGVYSLLGSFAMAELGAMIPCSGGYYVLTRRAYGEYVSFAVGWTDWMGLCSSGALVAILAGDSTTCCHAWPDTKCWSPLLLSWLSRWCNGAECAGAAGRAKHHQRDYRCGFSLPYSDRTDACPQNCLNCYSFAFALRPGTRYGCPHGCPICQLHL
jgi:hypothetical protein